MMRCRRPPTSGSALGQRPWWRARHPLPASTNCAATSGRRTRNPRSSTPPSAAGATRTGVPDRCLLDTDVVSYGFRGDTRADLYRDYLSGTELAVSFMTVAELRRWALVRGWGMSRREQLERYLHRFDIYYANDAL